MNNVVYILVDRSKWLFLVTLFILLLMGLSIQLPEIDGRLTGFNAENSKYYQAGIKMKEQFASEEMIQLKITPSNTNTSQVFEGLKKLESKFKLEYPNARFQSLHYAKRLFRIKDKKDVSIFKTLENAEELPLVNLLISKDKQSFQFLIYIDSTDHFDLKRFNDIINSNYEGIDKIIAFSRYHLENGIKEAISHDLVIISGMIALFFIFFLLYVYRSIRALIFSMIIINISLLPTIFLFSVLNIPINLITVLVIPIVLILSVADAVHLLTGYNSLDIEVNKSKRIKSVLKKYLVPSMLTSLTTAAAFFSFLLNDSPNIQKFGLLTGSTVLIAFVFTFFSAPFLMQFLRVKNLAQSKIGNVFNVLDKKKKQLTFLLSILFLISLALLPRIKFDTDFDSFIPRNADIAKNHDEITEDFHSQMNIEIMISNGSESNNDNLQSTVFELHNEFESYPEVSQVNSYKDQADFKASYGFASQFINFPKKDNPYRSFDGLHYRIRVLLNDAKYLEGVESKIHSLSDDYSDELEFNIFSGGLLLSDINSQVAHSLLLSLIISGIFISFFILIMTRSFLIMIISVYANLVPLSFIVLIFYLFDLNINITTSITAVICVGLIVDDTIHVLYRKLILKEDLKHLAYGILTTSILLFGGFISFSLSSFVPSQVFGVTCAFIFIFTMVSDLTILPYLLSLIKANK